MSDKTIPESGELFLNCLDEITDIFSEEFVLANICPTTCGKMGKCDGQYWWKNKTECPMYARYEASKDEMKKTADKIAEFMTNGIK